MEKTSEGVRAVERALAILQAFTLEDSQLSAIELARRVGLSRPTLYRLLYTLENQGYIVSEGDPQRFSLGPAVARLAHIWAAGLDLPRLARPVLQQVWEQTRETVALFVPRGDLRLCVAELPCPQPLSFKRGVGYSEKIERGASGRAILAYAAPTAAQLARYSQALDIEPARLQRDLAQVKKKGYAESHDELMRGATAVAAPFFDRAGAVAGSIGVFGPAVRLDKDRVASLAALVTRAAAELSAMLGHAERAPGAA
ncbi:IclR family transcriptional regulator [Bordetella petrii]|uniref:IclR family transcriptional regulator n=1 Tax=Bordetella petrii TaxID=94624 RepID=UPI001A95AA78|nr:IclR family transcriptional regulator [Bordetella petrii]MBO1113045.1 IclR family transcriptional regulator [Bordetella petrii]